MAIIASGSVHRGTTGADDLNGSSLNDVFYMTADNYVTDRVNGGTGNDTIDYSASQVGLTITLTDPTLKAGASGGTVEADFTNQLSTRHQVVARLTSIENATGSEFGDTITGNSVGNVLSGGAGDDVINGRGGNDTIYGGRGADILTGGLGADTFVFTEYQDSGMTVTPRSGGGYNTINHGIDEIQDFRSGEDKIDLSQIDADTARSGDQAFHVVDQFSGHAGELRLWLGTSADSTDPVNQAFFILQGDINGDATADFELHVWATEFPMVNPANDFLL